MSAGVVILVIIIIIVILAGVGVGLYFLFRKTPTTTPPPGPPQNLVPPQARTVTPLPGPLIPLVPPGTPVTPPPTSGGSYTSQTGNCTGAQQYFIQSSSVLTTDSCRAFCSLPTATLIQQQGAVVPTNFICRGAQVITENSINSCFLYGNTPVTGDGTAGQVCYIRTANV